MNGDHLLALRANRPAMFKPALFKDGETFFDEPRFMGHGPATSTPVARPGWCAYL